MKKIKGLNKWEQAAYEKLYPELIKINYEPETDELSLITFLRHMYYIELCKKEIEEQGLFVETLKGSKVLKIINPAHSLLRQNSESALRWARCLGLSAHSRKQLGIEKIEIIEDNDLF